MVPRYIAGCHGYAGFGNPVGEAGVSLFCGTGADVTV